MNNFELAISVSVPEFCNVDNALALTVVESSLKVNFPTAQILVSRADDLLDASVSEIGNEVLVDKVELIVRNAIDDCIVC